MYSWTNEFGYKIVASNSYGFFSLLTAKPQKLSDRLVSGKSENGFVVAAYIPESQDAGQYIEAIRSAMRLHEKKPMEYCCFQIRWGYSLFAMICLATE
jgi:hypothetical protein